MAEAKKTTKTVVEENITLTLTRDEAEVLTAVFGFISGPDKDGPYKHYLNVYEALVNAGVRSYYASGAEFPAKYIDRARSKGIYFLAKPYRSDSYTRF